MPIKTILLPLRESDMTEHMLECGMLTARQHRAHLDVFYVHPKPEDMLPYATLGLTGGMRESLMDTARQKSADQAGRLQTLFEAVRERVGVQRGARAAVVDDASADWVEEHGVRSELVARYGRLADLILMPRPERANPPPKTFEAIMRETGRPLLMVPRGRTTGALTGHVVIGWNGSAESAQAVAVSRPLLRAASGVSVVVSTKRKNQRPNADDVVRYLTCHGIAATARVVDMERLHVGEHLAEECDTLGAGLLVVGGYSRTRLQEMLLGGVTRYLIREAKLPVLMVH